MISASNGTDVKCIVFDFAGTLCSEGYFHELEPEYYEAVGSILFGKNSSTWADPWMTGELSSSDIADHLATLWPLSRDDILSSLRKGCSHMTFNPAVWEFALRQHEAGLKLALVTVNADIFTEVVAPAHGLDKVFQVIVNSADYGHTCKEVLFRKAFELLGAGYAFPNSLLIDDSEGAVDCFEKLGGIACRYAGDAAFCEWVRENWRQA